MNSTITVPSNEYEQKKPLTVVLILIVFVGLLISLIRYVENDYKFELPQDSVVNIPLTSTAEGFRSFAGGDATLSAWATLDQFNAMIDADGYMMYTRTARYGGVYGVKYRWIDQKAPEGLGHRMFILSVDSMRKVKNSDRLSWRASIDLDQKHVLYQPKYSKDWHFYHGVYVAIRFVLVVIIALLLFALWLIQTDN